MSTDPPLFSPYDDSFEYDAGNDEDDDHNSVIIEAGEEELVSDNDNYVGELSAACDGIDESFSSPV